MEALAVILVIALSTWLTVGWRGRYWRKRVARWADSEGVQLLHCRAAKRREGLARSAPTEGQSVFRVRVCDRDGAVKEAWLTFGRPANRGSAPDELIDVTWDR
ncbi:MAG: hypothetical protein ACK6C0_03590 [Betaproteobacteria bacterium]|jgi:hypothetical protein